MIESLSEGCHIQGANHQTGPACDGYLPGAPCALIPFVDGS